MCVEVPKLAFTVTTMHLAIKSDKAVVQASQSLEYIFPVHVSAHAVQHSFVTKSKWYVLYLRIRSDACLHVGPSLTITSFRRAHSTGNLGTITNLDRTFHNCDSREKARLAPKMVGRHSCHCEIECRSDILFSNTGKVHRPRKQEHFDIRELEQNRSEIKMLAHGGCFPQPCSKAGCKFATSRSRLNYT